MESVLVSVVVPAYKQAPFLGDAIRSVLNQTYPHFEVIVVDDASPDATSNIVKSFVDPRVKLIVHSENRGLSASRNSGILASTGTILAFLDADDMFLPDKLRMHLELLTSHPNIGVTYNARFELNHSDTTIRELWRPPRTAGLLDLVIGFPFCPSDMVVRREWLSKVGLFDPSVGTAEDTDLPCRLALAGCKFAGVDRALNYRRYHSGRGRKNLRSRLNDVARVLDVVFGDPRCSDDVLAIQKTAIKYHLMAVMSVALIQEETELGQELILELIDIDPSVIKGHPCELLEYLLRESIADENLDHETLLRSIFIQLRKEIAGFSAHHDWSVARGYLLRAIRAVMWDRLEDGKRHFARALDLKAAIDEKMLKTITYQLSSYEIDFGADATRGVMERLAPYLDQFRGRNHGRKLKGSYWVNRAFQNYRAGEYAKVPGMVLRALANDLSYFANRGVLAILVRSFSGMARRAKRAS
jgi:glycosyltransferase involved in cell wall biosynthesis